MEPLRCTVIDAVDPRSSVDLDVHAAPGTPWHRMGTTLLRAAGLPPDRVVTADGRTVDRGARRGERPLVDGVILVADLPHALQVPPPAAVLRWHVTGGPDAGAALALRPGRHTVGRGADVTLRITDANLSRRHLSLTVTADGVRLHDLGSSNGTTVDGVPVPAEGVDVAPGRRVTAGGSTFEVRLHEPPPTAPHPDGRGGLAVLRSTRGTAVPGPVALRRPQRPEPADPAKVPWAAVVAPVLLCVPMAMLLHQPTYLAFGLLGPLIALATAGQDRVGRRREQRRALERWSRDDAQLTARLRAALDDELAVRRRSAPDPARLVELAARAGPGVYERTGGDDVLAVALGRGTVTSQVEVQDGETAERVDLLEAPLVVRLDEVGHLALLGDHDRALACAQWVVGQLATLASPHAVRLVVTQPSDAWHWARWLPHVTHAPLDQVEEEVRRRQQSEPRQPGRPHLVVLVDASAGGATEPARQTVAVAGPAVGVHLVVCGTGDVSAPAGCRAVVRIPSRGAATLERTGIDGSAATRTVLALDGIGRGVAERLARALAPLRDAATGPTTEQLPAVVHLMPLLELDQAVPAAEALVERWTGRPRSTTAVLGTGPDGVVTVDLVRDGPHALVAGTTGSGKSELLQTLVASLAAGNRPDELSFVLVDYKGGAAFRGCLGLPHVTGVVTDLDDRLAARALASLQAELTRRERVLADAGSVDIAAHQAAPTPGRPHLGRLVIVIDEYRLLAVELPEFIDGLVRLAAVGRSLGVHLVLATQRPAGIVSADIRANVNLRICLRVRDRSDSHDVLDAADAASLPDDVPGRALLRTGSGELTSVQVALAAGPAPARRPDEVVVTRAGSPLPAAPGPDQLELLVSAARSAADRLNAHAPPSPWLRPLPDVVPWPELRHHAGREASAVGVQDLPAEGRQPALSWHPRRDSHLAISGTARTGRSSALLTTVLAAVSAEPDCHLHVVDPSGATLAGALTGLPHVGTVITGERPRLVRRLVARLADEARRRDPAPTLLVVDGWDTLVQQLDRADHGQGVDELLALVRDGETTGLRLLVAGGRGVLTSRLTGLVAERLVLRCADPTDLLLAGAPSGSVPRHQPPGRAVHLPSCGEVQVAWSGTAAAVREQLGRAAPPPDRPLRLTALPASVHLGDLPPASSASSASSARTSPVVLGLAGDHAEPARLDLDGLVAVVGPPGSGRSTTLRTVAEQLHARGGPLVVVTASASPLQHGPWRVVPPDGVEGVPRLTDDAAVLVDDADLLAHTAADGWLASLAATPGRCVVVSSTTSHLAATYTGWVAVLRRRRTGVLLQPAAAHDGEAFGIRAEPPDDAVPGRGLLVLGGRAATLQVATPSPVAHPSATDRAVAGAG